MHEVSANGEVVPVALGLGPSAFGEFRQDGLESVEFAFVAAKIGMDADDVAHAS